MHAVSGTGGKKHKEFFAGKRQEFVKLQNPVLSYTSAGEIWLEVPQNQDKY